ncbi:MAG: glycosyltransferase family 2 protein [Acidimicrobiia bacterium]
MRSELSVVVGLSAGERPLPLVSVVIPAHNAEAFVADAILSVLSQTHERVELVVVDDGSDDRTREIAESFRDERLRVLGTANRGVSHARNRGLEAATGEIIAFLDADDRWFSEKLERQVPELGSNPHLLAVGSFMRYESLDGRMLGQTGQAVGGVELELVASGRLMPFPLSSILFKTSAVRQLGGFDETRPRTVGAEDLDLLARVASLGEISCVEEVLGAYRVHPKSRSATGLANQRMGVRFTRARLAGTKQGRELTWHAFASTYRPSWRQRHGDFVQANYRKAGQSVAGHRWFSALARGLLALATGPRYTLRRFLRQLGATRRNNAG